MGPISIKQHEMDFLTLFNSTKPHPCNESKRQGGFSEAGREGRKEGGREEGGKEGGSEGEREGGREEGRKGHEFACHK